MPPSVLDWPTPKPRGFYPFGEKKANSSRWSVSARCVLLVAAVAVLTVLGLIVLYSASRALHADSAYLLRRQFLWLGFASFAMGFFALCPMEWMRKCWPLVALGTAAGLILVLIPSVGVEVNGARRWLDLGPMRLQPAEFAKFGMVLLLAHYLASNQRFLGQFVLGFLIPCLFVGIFCLLILRQPDFGTAFLCAAVAGTMLFVAGTRVTYLTVAALLGLALFGLMVYHDPIRLERLVSFINVEENLSGGAYQLSQGIIAFGVGGWFGVGPGNGRQQMAFLPEAHTDFIFAIMGEELGLAFTGLVVLLFGMIFLFGFLWLRRAPDLFQFSLVFGAVLFIVYQAVINLGVVTGSMPTKGMSLPFISYGGSNLVFVFAMIGLLLNAFRTWEKPLRGRPSEL